MISTSPSSPGRIPVRIDPDLADLIPGYLDKRRQDIAAVLEALDRQAYDAIRTTGHKMKGSGGGYGFDRITEIGAALEAAARETDSERIRASLQNLADYLDRIDIVYEQPD